MRFNQITSRLFSYFVRGLLLLAPVYLTGSIIFSVFDKLDEQFYFYFRGTGIVVLVGLIVGVGFIGSTFIAVPVFRIIEDLLKKIPLINLIYFSFKDLISAFVGDKKKFDKPVLFVLNKENGIHKIGFITQESLKSLMLDDDLVVVYCPHSYAFSGETFIIPSTHLKPLNMSSSQVMKFIVSGGVSINTSENE